MNKTVMAVVCVVVIVVAVGLIVKQQVGTSGPPAHVLAQKADYICTQCGAQETLTLGDWQDLSADAKGYRKCPKCSAMGLWPKVTCPHCQAAIPAAPPAPEAAGAAPPAEPPKYMCPKCQKDVNTPPDAPPAAK